MGGGQAAPSILDHHEDEDIILSVLRGFLPKVTFADDPSRQQQVDVEVYSSVVMMNY